MLSKPNVNDLMEKAGNRYESVIAIAKRARQIEKRDYEKFDYIIGMDEYNLRNLIRFFKNDYKHKISLLLDYTSFPRDVDDPWYSGDFEQTYLDIIEGINGLLDKLNVRK